MDGYGVYGCSVALNHVKEAWTVDLTREKARARNGMTEKAAWAALVGGSFWSCNRFLAA